MSKATSNEPAQTPTTTRIPSITLASMPNEIKGNIVCWAPSSTIESLCLVNRTFYELCRPRLWRNLDLKDHTMDELEKILTCIIPKHSDHVRSIGWRITEPFYRGFEESSDDEPEEDYRWGTEGRSLVLLEILKACKRIDELDIDLHPSTDWQSTPFYSPMHKLIEPVSKLNSMIGLSLSAPCDQNSFSEDFLVSILTELNLLQSFTCKRILHTTDPVSPLGICLSNLKYLSAIDLVQADCVDLSWTKLIWTGGIEKLAFIDCEKVSLEFWYQFTRRFSSTLHYLRLDQPPNSDDRQFDHDFENGRYNFNLPRLHTLYIYRERESSSLPLTSFLKAFTTNCKELAHLGLWTWQSLEITKNFLKQLIRDKVWPDLKRVEVTYGGTQVHIVYPVERFFSLV